MFRIEDGIYYSRIFFAEIKAGREGNLMGAVYLEPGAKDWRFTYRFRWYNDDHLDEKSKDDRNWYDCVSEKSLDETLRAARLMFATASGVAGTEGYSELVIESDQAKEVFRVLSAQPWANMREAK